MLEINEEKDEMSSKGVLINQMILVLEPSRILDKDSIADDSNAYSLLINTV